MQCTKCVVVGDGFVGKTALVGVFSSKQYSPSYVPTIFDNKIVGLQYKKTWINLGVFDTAGQEEYDKLRPMAYTDTDVFIVCFSMVDKDSLENILNKWAPEIERFSPKAKMLLVGTKLDLWAENEYNGKAISQDFIDGIAQRIGAVDFIPVSALQHQGVEDVFRRVAEITIEETSGKKKRSECSVM